MTDRDLHAAVAWSRVVEPADEVAGGLVDAVGGWAAWQWLRAIDPDRHEYEVERLCERLGVLAATDRRRLTRAVARWLPRVAGVDVERDLRAIGRLGGRVVVPGSPEWPARLSELGPAAPRCLWVRGAPRVDVALARAVSLVGARASTGYGDRVAADLAGGLVDRGVTSVSGGAYGIDASVHRGTLAAQGCTVAVLAGGVDRLYPAGNTELLRTIIDRGGLVLSEVPPGSAPSRTRFLTRNRIIAAAGSATVVVEAAWRSGALSTAGRAAELHRPVGAVPGPVTSMASAGCHRLLRDGRATCVTDVHEVWELVGAMGDGVSALGRAEAARDAEARRSHDGLDALGARVLDAVPLRGGVGTEALARSAGVTTGECMAALGRLELAGLVEREGAGWVLRRSGVTGGRE